MPISRESRTRLSSKRCCAHEEYPNCRQVHLYHGRVGLFALAVAFYTGAQIQKIDTKYSALLDGEANAALYLARANRSMQNMRASIGDIVLSRTPELSATADKEFQTARESFLKFIDLAATAMPSAAEIPLLKTSVLKVVDEACRGAITAGLAANDETAVFASQDLFLKDCQPQFAAIAPKFTEVTTKMTESSVAVSAALTEQSNSTARLTLMGVVGGIAVVLGFGFIAIRSWLVRPIRTLADTMGVLAGGDLSVAVDGTERRDEVGLMARSVQIFKDNGLKSRELATEAEAARTQTEAERLRAAEADRKRAAEMAEATKGLAEGLQRLSDGDLTYQLVTPFAADFENLRADFNTAVDKLRQTLSAVSHATGAIDGGSRELSQSASDLSKRTEQQAASLEETAAALDEITVNVQNSSKRTEEPAMWR